MEILQESLLWYLVPTTRLPRNPILKMQQILMSRATLGSDCGDGCDCDCDFDSDYGLDCDFEYDSGDVHDHGYDLYPDLVGTGLSIVAGRRRYGIL